jgi:uncharacterized peroxidase-related enzyme
MPYIEVIHPSRATGRLAEIYQRVTGPGGQVDNVLQIHSLRPHTLEGHMALYKAVLHHPRNKLPHWFLEAVGVRVSLLNECDYCARHHAAGMQRHLRDEPEKYAACRKQLDVTEPGEPFSPAEQAALRYVDRLTRTPGRVGMEEVDRLRAAGFEDGHILEINQVTAYFAYANRTVTGLGVDTSGETLGLAPDDTTEDWHHV